MSFLLSCPRKQHIKASSDWSCTFPSHTCQLAKSFLRHVSSSLNKPFSFIFPYEGSVLHFHKMDAFLSASNFFTSFSCVECDWISFEVLILEHLVIFFSAETMFLQRSISHKHITHTAGNADTLLPYADHPNCRQNTAEEITFWVLNLQTFI